MELVAHRAGNQVADVAVAQAVDAAIELDVHWFRRRLEVRHPKVLWPFARQWEKWYLLPRRTRSPVLADALIAIDPSTTVLVDLKGFSPRLATEVRRALTHDRRVIVASRAWWLLRSFRNLEGVRTLRSAGNRAQLAVLLRTGRLSDARGAVVHDRLLRADIVARLRRRHRHLFAWAVDDLDRALALARLGVTGLILDDLDLLVDVRAHLSGTPGVDEPVE